jgi:Leucine-rich repeat (LRR) protein
MFKERKREWQRAWAAPQEPSNLAVHLAPLAENLRDVRFVYIGLGPEDADSLLQLTAATRLDVSANVLDTQVTKLSALTALAHLDVSFNFINNAAMVSVRPFTALTRLHTLILDESPNSVGCAWADLHALEACQDLHELSLHGNEVDHHGDDLSCLTMLKKLNLSYVLGGSFGNDVRKVARLSALTYLNLAWSDAFSDFTAAAPFLARLTALQDLHLDRTFLG